MLSSIIEEKC